MVVDCVGIEVQCTTHQAGGAINFEHNRAAIGRTIHFDHVHSTEVEVQCSDGCHCGVDGRLAWGYHVVVCEDPAIGEVTDGACRCVVCWVDASGATAFLLDEDATHITHAEDVHTVLPATTKHALGVQRGVSQFTFATFTDDTDTLTLGTTERMTLVDTTATFSDPAACHFDFSGELRNWNPRSGQRLEAGQFVEAGFA
ncbi:hypothetical protein D3C71_1104100 [compost metagenome]